MRIFCQFVLSQLQNESVSIYTYFQLCTILSNIVPIIFTGGSVLTSLSKLLNLYTGSNEIPATGFDVRNTAVQWHN